MLAPTFVIQGCSKVLVLFFLRDRARLIWLSQFRRWSGIYKQPCTVSHDVWCFGVQMGKSAVYVLSWHLLFKQPKIFKFLWVLLSWGEIYPYSLFLEFFAYTFLAPMRTRNWNYISLKPTFFLCMSWGDVTLTQIDPLVTGSVLSRFFPSNARFLFFSFLGSHPMPFRVGWIWLFPLMVVCSSIFLPSHHLWRLLLQRPPEKCFEVSSQTSKKGNFFLKKKLYKLGR